MPDSEPLVLFRRAPSGLNRRGIERFASQLRKRVALGREFHCLITSDAELQRLNREFLGRDYPTDVLSFPAAGTVGEMGEMAISGRRAIEQSRQFQHTPEVEICVLMLHGLLHLKGMDHERDDGAMARAEVAWRRKLGLPAGLIERVGR